MIVIRGTAIHDGQVDVKWIGGVQSESAQGYHPEVFQDDDRHRYHANDPVLLVISSDPFSVSEANKGMFYSARAELMETENLRFQSVEVQGWQGQGSHYNVTTYLQFLVILMVVVFGVYRVISVRR